MPVALHRRRVETFCLKAVLEISEVSFRPLLIPLFGETSIQRFRTKTWNVALGFGAAPCCPGAANHASFSNRPT